MLSKIYTKPTSCKNFICFLYCICFALLISITAKAQIITSFAGKGLIGYTGDGGPATAAQLNTTYGVAADDSGNVYIADNDNHVIRKVNSSGIISTFAGNGTTSSYGDGGPATAAAISYPNGITTDTSGNVYISDFFVRKIDKSNIITTVVGCCGLTTGGDGGPASAAGLNHPNGIFADRKGNLFITEDRNHDVRMVNSAGIISTIAGNGTTGYSGDGGPATNAQLVEPMGVATDAAGNIYIADLSSEVVRKVNTAGIISTFAGNGIFGHAGDGGPATAAEIMYPYDVKVDNLGNVYVSESGSSVIRKIDPSGIIHTYGGVAPGGYSGDGGPASAAMMNYPAGIDIDRAGNMYIACAYNYATRKISGIAGNSVLCVGDTSTLQNIMPGATWTSSAPGIATVNATTGLTTGVATGTATISYTRGLITTTATVNIYPVPNAGTLTGSPIVCIGSPIILSDAIPDGTWSTVTGFANATDSMVTGYFAGVDTIVYKVTTGCGSSQTRFPVTILTAAQCDSAASAPNISTNKNDLQLYPNPSKGTFTIFLSSDIAEQVPVIFTNMVGQKIKEVTISSNKKSTISFGMPAGIYFVSANTKTKQYVMRITVE